MTWASFISEVRVEFTVAVSFLMESSLTVVTGSRARREKRAPMKDGKEVESFMASLAVASASTEIPASLSETVVVFPSTVRETLAASARAVTAEMTWSRLMPSTEIPATVVPGRTRPE